MHFFRRLIDTMTLGSRRPIRRLVAYYAVLAIVVALLFHFVPYVDRLLSGEHVQEITAGPDLLPDALTSAKNAAIGVTVQSRADLFATGALIMISTLALMLPVSWVFMSARDTRVFSQGIAQTLIILPVVVAGIVLVVRTSLALAFSLAGIVAGLRFRTTLRDMRDAVYIFLAIGVGLAAGVQAVTVAAVVSITFNFVALFIWRYNFGRSVLEPTAASHWTEPLEELADNRLGTGVVPDRDLVLALSPKEAQQLAARFDRVQKILGPRRKKPRFNAVLSLSTDTVQETQQLIESLLNSATRRWRLDQVIHNEGKPSQLFYLVRLRKNTTRDQMITAVRHAAGNKVHEVEVVMTDVSVRQREATA